MPPAMAQLGSLGDLRRKASQLERSGWGKKQAADRNATECIDQWLKTQDCSQLSQRFTSSASSLQPVPATMLGDGQVVRQEGDQGLSAIRMVAWLHESKRTQNLSDVLVNRLGLKSRTITAADAKALIPTDTDTDPAAASVPKQKYKPTCLEAGVCLCSESGMLMWNLLTRLLTATKRVFPATGSLRQQLLKRSGSLMLVRGYPKDDVTATVKETKLWHIGIQYLSPFRPTFRECLSLAENLDADVVPIQAAPKLI